MSTNNPEQNPQDPGAVPAPENTIEQPMSAVSAETPAVEMTAEDQAVVLERLRELGYVD
jgi:hypothetical protein